jgi:prepilin-type N-terminal cleavage/methylation domain-containing protein
MKVPHLILFRRHSGFTLVELLVVIAIVAVLALTAFTFARRGLDRAAASKSLSRLRQSGTILLAEAQEKNGRMQYAVDDAVVDSPLLPYNIVRASLGIGFSAQRSAVQLCDIMHWDAVKLKPADFHRNCFGVNFTNIPDDPEGRGVQWIDEMLATENGTYEVRTLINAAVNRPDAYALLLDSSNTRGEEVFRIREDEGGFVGLRNSGMAHGFFLDGSARQLDSTGLKNIGFTRACDNSTSPPRMRNL